MGWPIRSAGRQEVRRGGSSRLRLAVWGAAVSRCVPGVCGNDAGGIALPDNGAPHGR